MWPGSVGVVVSGRRLGLPPEVEREASAVSQPDELYIVAD